MAIFSLSPYRKDDLVTIVRELFKILNVNHTFSELQRRILEHHEYPSLLTITDVINSHGLKATAVSGTIQNLTNYKTPFITQVSSPTSKKIDFTIVKSIRDGVITIYNKELGKWINYGTLDFISIWIPIVLKISYNRETSYEEPNYRLNVKRERILVIKKVIISSIFILFPITLEVQNPPASLLKYFLCIVSYYLLLFGAAFSLLLIQQHKNLLSTSRYCYLSSTFNCQKVLGSRFSNLAGISIPVIGFSYFGGNLIFRVVSLISAAPSDALLFFSGVLSIPFVLSFIYIQWRIIKSWCSICLFVHFLLIANAIITFTAWDYSLKIPAYTIYVFIVLLIFFFLLGSIYSFIVNLKTENRLTRKELHSFKYNPTLFSGILIQQRKVISPPDNIGLKFGSHHAKNTLLLVISPSCEICKKVLTNVNSILRTKDILVHLVIVPGKHTETSYTKTIYQFLSKQSGKSIEFPTLNSSSNNNWKETITEPELASEQKSTSDQLLSVEAIKNWAKSAGIKKVPTYVLNGYELPDYYSIKDLEYIFD